MLTKELQNRTKPAEADKFGRIGTSNARDPPEGPDGTYNSFGETKPHATPSGEQGPGTKISDVETEKYPLMASEVKYIEKSVIEEEPIIQSSKYGVSSSSVEQNFDEDGDDWLEDNTDVATSALPLGNEEDVSFSDLEDDDDGSRSPSARIVTDASDTDASKVSGQWMQLSESRRSSTKESGNVQKETNYWLNVDINTV